MMRITIEVADDGGITVTADGQEPYQCSSPDECLEYLGDMLKGEAAGEPEQATETGEPDVAAMWNEEAARRPKNPQMLG